MTDLYAPGHYAREWDQGDLLALYAYFERPAWHDRAACQGEDTETFFPERGKATAKALAICARCPVMAQCREAALSRPDTLGIWGGTTERTRRTERSSRRHMDPTRPTTGHGSEAGYKRHQRLKEAACTACREAHERYRNPTQATWGGNDRRVRSQISDEDWERMAAERRK